MKTIKEIAQENERSYETVRIAAGGVWGKRIRNKSRAYIFNSEQEKEILKILNLPKEQQAYRAWCREYAMSVNSRQEYWDKKRWRAEMSIPPSVEPAYRYSESHLAYTL